METCLQTERRRAEEGRRRLERQHALIENLEGTGHYSTLYAARKLYELMHQIQRDTEARMVSEERRSDGR